MSTLYSAKLLTQVVASTKENESCRIIDQYMANQTAKDFLFQVKCLITRTQFKILSYNLVETYDVIFFYWLAKEHLFKWETRCPGQWCKNNLNIHIQHADHV